MQFQQTIIDAYRRLCIKKDIKEIEQWLEVLENNNEDLTYLNTIGTQLIKSLAVVNHVKSIRRKNVLMVAALCKYEQSLKTEFEYGKVPYDEVRVKQHENKRQQYQQLIKDYNELKIAIYKTLITYRRR
ncbi:MULTISPECIES: hypothetical protein [Meridianimaribacter]|uniref:Uncharacterized protein n=1 Tax=Meridianimaribacter flavus TaxID=571115 RepID=A0ABY2G4J7_9FLAO|nr:MULTISPECIES: hypothetical protein [Meridianimaribacter]TBV25977.1 hypothetical protein DMZ43_08710 [Meridianimaribacter sp. CL38]TDY11351.1 hypothetical protein A8975_1988 [Meridianimaribacter flavus]